MPGNELFAAELARLGGYELGTLETRRFPDGESYSRLQSDVQGRSIYIICSLSRPDDKFLLLAFTADLARELGAAQVHLIAPYLCYMRQDTRFQPGEAITSRTFARLLSSLFDSLITVDAHLHRYKELAEIYTVPAYNLHAGPVMAQWIGKNVTAPFLIGPDEDSSQWVESIASESGVPFTVLRKTRHGDRDVTIELPDLSVWREKQPVLIDDIASSGRTMIEAARQIVSQGLEKPVCVVVHGLFAEEAYRQLATLASRIISTDSVSHPSNAISLASTFLAAIESGKGPQTR